MTRRRGSALGIAFALALLLPGCLDGISSEGVVKGDKSVTGDVRVEGGHLRIEPGASWALTSGTLALSADPSVVVDGEIEVRGDLTLREVTIHGLYRVIVHSTGRLVMENVTVAPSSVPATFVLAGNATLLRGLDADVMTIHVRGPTIIDRSTLRASPVLPAVQSRADLEIVDTTLTAEGHGILIEAGVASIRRSTIGAGTNGTFAAVAVTGGRAEVENSTLTGAIGIAFDGAGGKASGNIVRNATTAAIAARGPRALEIAQNTIEGGRRAGIALQNAGPDTLVRANVVTGVAGDGWSGTLADIEKASAGIVVDGGAPVIEANDIRGCENGIAILQGNPTIRENNLEANTHYGIVYNVSAGDRPIDVTMNWWGSPAGPVPNAPGPVPGPSAAEAQRVGPGLVYSPWRATRREL